VVLALLLIVGASAYFFRRLGRNEAVRDARVVTATIARTAIVPALRPGIVTGDPRAVAALDRVVHRDVLGSDLVRIKVWTPAGRILYSDEPRLIGTRYVLDDEERQALRSGRAAANVSDLTAPENRYERGYGKLLQVYLPIRGPDGRTLLFETYHRFSAVAASGSRLWLKFLPVLLVALALLAAVQLSLAWSLARRLRAGQQEREQLLVKAIQASSVERRRIAADLHDTVVQDLTGISLSLGAAAAEPQAMDEDAVRSVLRRSAAATRQTIRRLRSLLVDIYPPNLQAEGLPAALSDLVSTLSERGIEASLDVPASLRLPPTSEQAVFRCAQEALRNVASHSRAHRVTVSLSTDDSSGTAVLVVEDDGDGFTSTDAAQRRGHLGLSLLADAAADAGGELTVDSQPGCGTRIRLEVPAL
jgi:two-component system NarL family sensor kinase